MKKFFKKIWSWLVLSSANPSQYSLTLKASGVTLITLLTIVGGVANVKVPNDLLTQFLDQFIATFQMVMLAVGSLTALYGILRKVLSSITRTNQVINTHPDWQG